MNKAMTPKERVLAAMNNETTDHLVSFPMSCEGYRTYLPGDVSYSEWSNDPKLFAESMLIGQQHIGGDIAVGAMGHSVIADSLLEQSKTNEKNSSELVVNAGMDVDYDTLEIPNISKGKIATLLKGIELMDRYLGDQVMTSAFLESPLLALSQTVGAEKLYMDMFNDPQSVHQALRAITDLQLDIVDAIGQTDTAFVIWNCPWGDYSSLDESEYAEFDLNYLDTLNRQARRNGIKTIVHNDAELPQMDVQINKLKPAIYSMSHYPQIEGSPSICSVIDNGYADKCLIASSVNPEIMSKGSTDMVEEIVRSMCYEAKTAMRARDLMSRWCITSCCNTAAQEAKAENIAQMVRTVKNSGTVG